MLIYQATNKSVIQSVLPLIKSYWHFEHINHFQSNNIANSLHFIIDHPECGGLWLAFNAGQCVGYLLLTYQFSLEYGGMVAEVDELFVEDRVRGQGIGQKLLNSASALLREQSFVGIQLQVAKANEAAIKFYHEFGFDARSDYYLMTKSIA